ncbi:MAG TPA: PhzF family phenazine biosynthesis protein [Polyangiaceae bacterium]|nr:PhzF family phenazine biosynthesis protein [Polyangiaceae bacterium]
MDSGLALSYGYKLVNVFAERPFAGKRVAVFTDATGLADEQMAAIARELSLPQCSFVFPSSDPQAHAKIRVFTPTRELPRAGLPTIATVFALDLQQKGSRPPAAQRRIVLEERDGPVSVAVFAPLLTVKQDLPVFGRQYPEPEAVAAMLSLRREHFLDDAPLQAVSSGVPYLIVALKNRQTLESIAFRRSIWERTLQRFEAPNLLAFSVQTSRKDTRLKIRVFSPEDTEDEEPASESACGPVVGYAVRHGLLDLPPAASLAIEQGTELGRPSILHVSLAHANGALTELRVGGQCRVVGEGVVHV